MPVVNYSDKKQTAKAEPIKEKVNTLLADGIAEANLMAQQGKIYNPYPEILQKQEKAKTLFQEGLKTYLDSSSQPVERIKACLNEAKSKFESAGKEGYDPEQISMAIDHIDKEFKAYSDRGI
jgi:hypothetical protein